MSKPVILVVEDEQHILSNIIEILTMNDFDVHGAENGVIGVQQARTLLPDLIFCDINMPQMDGYNVLMELRSEAYTSNIPFVFLTAFVDRQFERRGMTLGAEDYLTKPFTAQEIITTAKTQLRKAADRQADIDKLRNNMIASLPHELRTPLTGIVTCADLLLLDIEEKVFDLKRAEQTIQIIHNSGKRLQRLIENHLLYSQLKLYAGDAEKQRLLAYPEGMPVPTMSTIMAAATQAAEEVNRTDDLQTDEENAKDSVMVRVSAHNLAKIAYELVGNALKFSEVGQKVMIRTWTTDDAHYFSVRNQGRGLQPEQIASIAPYIQFEREYYEQQGLGLGLVISRMLAQVHGGTLTVTSEPGEWLEVTVQLPLMAEGD